MKKIISILLFVLFLTVSASAVLVTWEPPTDPGSSPISGYTVYWGTETNKEEFNQSVPATQTSLIIDSNRFMKNITYYFCVRAWSVDGKSDPCEYSTWIHVPYQPPADNLSPINIYIPPGTPVNIIIRAN